MNGKYSYELCGGTHVPSTAVISSFIITAEGSVAQGTRRIEALTGAAAQQYIARQMDILRQAALKLGTTAEGVLLRIDALQAELAEARRESARLRSQLAKMVFDALLAKTEQISGANVLVAQVGTASPETLREMTDWFRDRMKSGVVVFGALSSDEKPQLIAAVTDDLTKRVHAGDLIKQIAPIVGGGGGGRPNMAQAGGKEAGKLSEALSVARKLVVAALSNGAQ
jgi:alanyl-tRNA synthetase